MTNRGLVLVTAGLKDLQRSLPANASRCELVNLSSEVMKALGRDDFYPILAVASFFVAQNY